MLGLTAELVKPPALPWPKQMSMTGWIEGGCQDDFPLPLLRQDQEGSDLPHSQLHATGRRKQKPREGRVLPKVTQ